MALPKQVKAQIEEANRISAEMAAAGDPEAADDEEVTAATDEVDGEDAETHDNADTSFSAEQAEVQEAESAEQADKAGHEPQANLSEIEHKYKTLQGMYNSEKRRSAELIGRIDALENMLAKQQEARQVQASESAEKPLTVEQLKLLSQEEIDDYGSDLIDVMKRAALEAVQGELDELRKENKQLKQVIGGVGQKQEHNERDKFYAKLDSSVTNWRTVNKDERFLDWLAENDAYAGEPRRALLTRAFQANDADRVSRFFLGFLNETAAVQKATAKSENPRPSGKGKVDLQSLAAPGDSSSGSADNTGKGSGRMWKESDIGAFYDAVRKGKYKGRDDEYKRLENQIHNAMLEGKILLGQ
jgi:hypothetical protein